MASARRPASNRIIEILLFLTLGVSYAYFFPRWADPNQNSRLDMIVAVVDDGVLYIDRYVQNTVDYAKVGVHSYSDKAPGTAFVGIPVYAALKPLLGLPVMEGLVNRLANSPSFQSTLREGGSGVLADKVRFALAQVVLTWIAAALPTALLGVLLYRYLERFVAEKRLRLGLALAYGLLTPAFAYAGAFYGHQLAAFLLFAAFYLLSRQTLVQEGWRFAARLVAVGIFLAYSVVSEYPALLIAAILYLYAAYRLYRERRLPALLWISVPAALIAAGWMAYNTAVFGGPLSLGYSYSEQWLSQHHTGFMSLTAPSLAAAWGITFGIFRGLFVLAPWLLLALPGFALWWRCGERRAEWGVAVASSLAFFLFNAASIMWWGGFSIGPRYLLPALPFFALAAVFAWREWGGHWATRLLTALGLLVSLLATWGLTLAGQAFPSDALRNPWLQYALPNWQSGNIARSLGTILGLKGPLALVPLGAVLLAGLLALYFLTRPNSPEIHPRV